MSDLRMNAYYYSFDETGVREIDEVLSAVATAGKHYHNTEYWGCAWEDDEEKTEAYAIQQAANRAADALRKAKAAYEYEVEIPTPFGPHWTSVDAVEEIDARDIAEQVGGKLHRRPIGEWEEVPDGE